MFNMDDPKKHYAKRKKKRPQKTTYCMIPYTWYVLGDENVLKLIVVMVLQFYKYINTKKPLTVHFK